jgi:hypothetical protein
VGEPDDAGQVAAFVAAWAGAYGDLQVGVRKLLPVAERVGWREVAGARTHHERDALLSYRVTQLEARRLPIGGHVVETVTFAPTRWRLLPADAPGA